MEIISTTPISIRPNIASNDILLWVEDSHGVFSIRSAWDFLRERRPEVEWYRSVWFAKAVPRHAFILWLATRGALLTQDKFFAYGSIPAMRCVFCGGDCEDIPHLFFECTYTFQVWSTLLQKCRLHVRRWSWEDTIRWLGHFHGQQLRGWVVRIMVVTAIYVIWRDRNARMHGDSPHPESVIIHDIVLILCNHVNSFSGLVLSPSNRWFHQS